MEVILHDGYGINLTIKAMRMYLERAGLGGYLYAWPEEEGYDNNIRKSVRIDDDADFPDGYEPYYDVVLKDLGKEATFNDVRENLLLDIHNPFDRTDKILIDLLRELKSEATLHASPTIATIPDDIEWYIDSDSEYGTEWVVEGHYPRRWYGKPL